MAAENNRYFVTRESQEASGKFSRKESYAGLRDLTDLEKIKELDIVGPDGTLRGIKNRVRAGLATYENQGALVKRNTEEGAIVVYTTSFRGVRHTYEECRYILTVFHNLRVSVQERDIYVHKLFHRELEERLGIEQDAQLPVPQVYINGQHVGGKSDLEILNETGELRRLIANIPRQETSAKCQTCAGYQFIPCRKCGGSKNSVANNFTSEFRALRCTHCSENGMEPCPTCATRIALTREEKEAIEAEKKEKELWKKIQEKERREKIKQEALEAEKELQLERERIQKKKEKKKEWAKLEKERKKRAAEIRQRVVADIAREAEREKQWQAEHEDVKEQELTNESPHQVPEPQECSGDKIEDEDHTAAIEEQESVVATVENTEQPGEEVESVAEKTTQLQENDSSHDLPITEVAENETETLF